MAKKNLQCQACQTPIGKAEAQFVDEDTFALLSQPPAGIAMGTYCNSCYDARVWPDLESYREKVERAKDVNIFYASQSKESRFVRRTEKPIRVKDCVDREEAILRLALMAVEAGLNALVDVAVTSTKVRNGGWQSCLWGGQGIPAHIDEAQLNRKYIGAPN